MKRLLLVLTLAVLVTAGFSQGLFKPVPKDLLSPDNVRALGKSTALIPRFTLGITAQQFSWNKEEGRLEQATLSKVGIGLGIAHYITLADGTLYNDFTVTPLCLFPTTVDSGMTLAAVISALKFANLSPGVGVGYDFGIKKVVGLFNAVLTF